MIHSFRRVSIGLLFGLSVALLPWQARAAEQPAEDGNTPAAPTANSTTSTNSQVAEVDQLESQAFQAIRDGQFDKTSQLLSEAASKAQDPQVQRMAQWAVAFKAEEQKFSAQRQQEFEKNVADIHKLLDHGMPDYAIGAAAAAYLRAPDQDEFRHEKWIDDLVNETAADAQKAEDNQQWFVAQGIYADLTGLDPYKPEWKTHLNDVMRRMELVALYAPDQFKAMRDDYDTASKPAEAILRDPNTPAPATQPAADDNQDFKFDWHDSVKGISNGMLADALIFAEHDYFRDAPYQKLLTGGLNGMKILATTNGLEKTFPGLADVKKREAFLDGIQTNLTQVAQLSGDDQEPQVRVILDQIQDLNHETVDLPDEVFVDEFTNAALATLDPFTSMIWPEDLEEFNKSTEGEFSGIGVQIQSDEQGNLEIVTPLEDSPAYKAGIGAGDIITHINGKNAKGITLLQAVHTITGPPETSVKLTIKSPDGSIKDYTIIRETINVASIKGYVRKPGGGWDYFVDPENKIAYIRLTNFTKNSGPELITALQDLKQQGAKALIFDLRDNPGGLLNAAVEVASQFINTGTIVSTHPDRDTENRPMIDTALPDEETTDIPLVVLVNQYSASASEIVSGALKDDKRATIVGERTFGKGSVQMLFPLADRTAYLKLTTAHYYLPSGRCLHRDENSTVWGVDPDIKIAMTPEQMRDVIETRQKMDVLRETAQPTTKPAVITDMLATDPQLSAALLVLRLKLAGAQM